MNKNQRQVWLELSRVYIKNCNLHLAICNFCKYSHLVVDCGESCFTCKHKSEYIQENSFLTWAGNVNDCSGFYPYTSLDITAEYISQLMQGKSVNLPSRQHFKELNKK